MYRNLIVRNNKPQETESYSDRVARFAPALESASDEQLQEWKSDLSKEISHFALCELIKRGKETAKFDPQQEW